MNFISAPDTGNGLFSFLPQLLIGLAVVFLLVIILSVIKFRKNRAQLRDQWKKEKMARDGTTNRGDALDISPLVAFTGTPIMGKQGLQVMTILETVVGGINASFSIFIRCGLEQFVKVDGGSGSKSEQDDAQRSLKSEVLDFLVVNTEGLPILAVNYYTEGPTADPRNSSDPSIETLRTTLHQAGIRFFEIEPDFSPRDLKKRLKKVLKTGIL